MTFCLKRKFYSLKDISKFRIFCFFFFFDELIKITEQNAQEYNTLIWSIFQKSNLSEQLCSISSNEWTFQKFNLLHFTFHKSVKYFGKIKKNLKQFKVKKKEEYNLECRSTIYSITHYFAAVSKIVFHNFLKKISNIFVSSIINSAMMFWFLYIIRIRKIECLIKI